MIAGECVSVLARELGIGRKFLYAWREAGYGSAGPQPPVRGVKRREPASDSERQAAALKNRISELDGQVRPPGGRTRFFRRSLAQYRGITPDERRRFRQRIYATIEAIAQGPVSVEEMCQAAGAPTPECPLCRLLR